MHLLESYYSSLYSHIGGASLVVGIAIVVCLIWVLWLIFGRDPIAERASYGDLSLHAISPGLSGLLIKERFDELDLIAALLGLGKNGVLKIEEIHEPRGTDALEHFAGENRLIGEPLTGFSYRVELCIDPSSAQLESHERQIVDTLFHTPKETTVISKLGELNANLKVIKSLAWDDVVRHGWFKSSFRRLVMFWKYLGTCIALLGAGFLYLAASYNHETLLSALLFLVGGLSFIVPAKVVTQFYKSEKTRVEILGVMESIPLTFIGVILLIIAAHFKVGSPIEVPFLIFLTGILLYSTAEIMPRKTPKGVSVASFLKEQQRFVFSKVVGQYSFEELLPYGLSLGVLPQLISHFENIKELNPHYFIPWYRDLIEGENIRHDTQSGGIEPGTLSDNIATLVGVLKSNPT